MARGEHELVAIRMLRAPIVVVQPAPVAAREVRDDVERRVRQRPAEMAGLRVVAEQHQCHAGHEADVFELLQIGKSSRSADRDAGVTGCTLMSRDSSLRDLV